MHFLYILYSSMADKYYVGETNDPIIRLHQHNNSYFKGSYTGQAQDWECKLLLEFESRIQARQAEIFIKKMKSRVFIERLFIDSEWLIQKFRT